LEIDDNPWAAPQRIVAIVQDAGMKRDDDASMRTPTPIAVGRAARHPLARVRRAFAFVTTWLRTRWPHVYLSREIRYLNNATDHADLERRMRALERCGF
jgi:hypothetical protein